MKTARTETEIKARDVAVKEGPYPTKPHPVTYYSSVEANLFNKVIDQYMSNPHEAKKHRSEHTAEPEVATHESEEAPASAVH